MTRQHATPLVISADGIAVAATRPMILGSHGLNEASIQELVHRFPQCLPIAEIDPQFVNPIPICRELVTPAGAVDNFMVTSTGLPVLVECKLWRNPEGRREVIGQILDYSKELTRWSSSDLQREASRRLKRDGNPLFDLVRQAGYAIDEISFNDALTFNLRRGRFLLLIVGDGIREGVEAIADYLQTHAGLHFTLGLIEMPIYEMDAGSRIVVPRVLARTQNIVRTVISAPQGLNVVDGDDDYEETVAGPPDPIRLERRQLRRETRHQFWTDYLSGLRLDDPEQMSPSPSLGGHVVFKLGAPGGSSWITVYRDVRSNTVGLSLSSNVGSIGERASQLLAEDANQIHEELPGAIVDFSEARPNVSQTLVVDDLEDPDNRAEAITWLQDRTNAFVNALRPRIRSALRELE